MRPHSQACGLFSWLCPSCWGQPAAVGYAPYAAPACATPHLCPRDDVLSASVRDDELPAVVLEFARLVQPLQLLPFRTAGRLHAADHSLLPGSCSRALRPAAPQPRAIHARWEAARPVAARSVTAALIPVARTGACGSSVGMASLDATPMPLDNGAGSGALTPQPTFKNDGGQDSLSPTPDSSTRSSIMTMPRLLQPERQTKAMPVHRTSYEQPSGDGMVPLDVSGWRAAR